MSTSAIRWNPCVSHRGLDVIRFFENYFGDPSKTVVLVAGAGFDPRSKFIASALSSVLNDRIRALFLREERPITEVTLSDKAEENLNILSSRIPESEVFVFDVFGEDNAVIGGRNAVNALRGYDFEGCTDVIVDMSALSVGSSFPIIRYLLKDAQDSQFASNLHVTVAANSELDDKIVPVLGDQVGWVHGFRGQFGTAAMEEAARLWIPQLAMGPAAAFNSIQQMINPDETAPILPFPSSDPRKTEELVAYFSSQLGGGWNAAPWDIIYAAESDPVDLYMTIMRLHDEREPVFRDHGGAQSILTPIGSKALALGALMAACDRDLPVAYVEATAYEVDWESVTETTIENTELVHVWLRGEAYA